MIGGALVVALIIILIGAFALNGNVDDSQTASPSATVSATPEPTVEPTPEPTPAATATPEPTITPTPTVSPTPLPIPGMLGKILPTEFGYVITWPPSEGCEVHWTIPEPVQDGKFNITVYVPEFEDQYETSLVGRPAMNIPAAGCHVEIADGNGIVDEGYTDENGNFVSDTLPYGTYNIALRFEVQINPNMYGVWTPPAFVAYDTTELNEPVEDRTYILHEVPNVWFYYESDYYDYEYPMSNEGFDFQVRLVRSDMYGELNVNIGHDTLDFNSGEFSYDQVVTFVDGSNEALMNVHIDPYESLGTRSIEFVIEPSEDYRVMWDTHIAYIRCTPV